MHPLLRNLLYELKILQELRANSKQRTFLVMLRREASIRAVSLFVEHVSDLTPHLAYLFPVLMARGVPAGSLYDPVLELFVHDNSEHEAYKRCGR